MAHAKYEKKSKEIGGTGKIEKIQKATNRIKVELFKVEQRIGILQSVANLGSKQSALSPNKEEDDKAKELYDELFEL